MSKKVFVMGDLHGNYRALMQVLQRSGFDYDQDLLISLGDIADGYSEVPECIDELMKIKNFVWCLGNHDEWVQRWFSGKMDLEYVCADGEYDRMRVNPEAHEWLSQGGKSTFTAYMRRPELITKHRRFWLHKPILFHVYDKQCYVHAGFDYTRKIATYLNAYDYYMLLWSRDLWEYALLIHSLHLGGHIDFADNFKTVYIGHTCLLKYGASIPMHCAGVVNMDTGAGWYGCLSLMNVDTKEVFQSDRAKILYPNERGR